MQRPILDKSISLQDFKEFYWLKEELVAFGKSIGLDTSGGKIDIANRITYFLETGKIAPKANKPKLTIRSKFDWNNTLLTLETTLTDNYKNTENVRAFFTQHIGKHFAFNTQFMNWAKANTGKTLQEAVYEWSRIYALKKDKSNQTEIAPQFEYNRYIRAFLLDNPDKGAQEAMKYWKLKRAQRGSNEYNKTDLELNLNTNSTSNS